MAEATKISEAPLRSELKGTESVPLTDSGLPKGRTTVDDIKRFVRQEGDSGLESLLIYDVSELHPTSGLGGTNKYTIETAIAQIPEKYRRIGLVVAFRGYSGAMQYFFCGQTYYGNNWTPAIFTEFRSSYINDFFKDCYLYGNVDRSRTYYLLLVCNSDSQYRNGLMIGEVDDSGDTRIVVSILNQTDTYVFDGGAANGSGIKLKAIVDFSVFQKGNTQQTLFFRLPDSVFTEGEFRRTFATDALKKEVASLKDSVAGLEEDILVKRTVSYDKNGLGNLTAGFLRTELIPIGGAVEVAVSTVCYTWNKDAIELFRHDGEGYVSVHKVTGAASSTVPNVLTWSVTGQEIEGYGATHMRVQCLPDTAFPDVTDNFSVTVTSVSGTVAGKVTELGNTVDALAEEVSDATADDKCEAVIPDVINAVVGDTLRIYYSGAFNCLDTDLYEVSVLSGKGKAFPRYWEYTPAVSDVGTTTITFMIGKYGIETEEVKVIASKECTLNTVNRLTDRNLNILHVGDSTLEDGYFAKETARRFSGTGGTPEGLGLGGIKAVGRKKVEGYGYEATGGWTWSTYVTYGVKAIRFHVTGVTGINIGALYTVSGAIYYVAEVNVTGGAGTIRCTYNWNSPNTNNPPASGTLTKYGSGDGTGDASVSYSSFEEEVYSPFFDGESGEVDFSGYANAYCDGNIDVIVCSLGINTIISRNSLDPSPATTAAKTFIDKFHEQFPSGKVGLCTIQMPSMKGGFGANYGASENSRQYAYKRRLFALNKAYIEMAQSAAYKDFVFLIDVCAEFDHEHAYPSEDKKVNLRSTETEKVETNAVHPVTTAKGMISDSIYRAVSALFAE